MSPACSAFGWRHLWSPLAICASLRDAIALLALKICYPSDWHELDSYVAYSSLIDGTVVNASQSHGESRRARVQNKRLPKVGWIRWRSEVAVGPQSEHREAEGDEGEAIGTRQKRSTLTTHINGHICEYLSTNQTLRSPCTSFIASPRPVTSEVVLPFFIETCHINYIKWHTERDGTDARPSRRKLTR